MKTWVLILVCWFSLSGCIIFGDSRKGPPPWAPAHGYRRKHTTIIVTPPHHTPKYKQGHDRGHGKPHKHKK